MPIDISRLDQQVDESIKRIDSYVKDPIKTGSLDTELNELLHTLNVATNEIGDRTMLANHNARIQRLNQKISEYEQKRNTITLQTRESLARSANTPDTIAITNLKKELEQEVASPITVPELNKLLEKLAGQDSDARKITISYLWSKLANAGYITTIQNWKISLLNPADQANAEALEATLNAYVDSRKINLSEIQRAVLVGSGSFGVFLDTQKANMPSITTQKYADFLASSLQIDLSRGNPASKIQIINKSRATPDEKAFLISFVNGGYTSYNLAPDAKRQMELREMSAELIASPQYTKVTATVDRASSGAYAREQEAIQKWGKKEELTIETFMDNPVRAITAYPWTAMALIAGSIWQFGFGKTFLWLFAGILGIKAINELGNTEMGRQAKENLKKWFWETIDSAKKWMKDMTAWATNSPAPAPVAVPVAAPSTGIDIAKLSPSQKKAYDKCKDNVDVKKRIENNTKWNPKENGDMDAYMNFIFSPEMQDQKLENIIYTSDSERDVFHNEKKHALSMKKPEGLNTIILKRCIRIMLIWDQDLSSPVAPAKEWDKEKADFIAKYPSTAWQWKTLADITNEINK